MNEQDTRLTYQQESVVNLLRSHVQSQKDAIQTLENKAQHNFTIINIIAAFVATLNLELGETNKIQQIINNRPLLILIFIGGYAFVVFLSLRALVLRMQATEPMTVSLKNAQDWSDCELKHHYDILIESYVQIYDHNEKIVKLKGRSVQWAHNLIIITIGLIVLESSGLLTLLFSWIETIFNQLLR